MATFAEGFGAGIVPGVYLAREMRERGQSRATKEMAEVLAELQSDDPNAGAFDATSQGVAEPGQPVRNPNQGFSGDHYAELRDRFYKAAVNSGNLDEFKKANDAWGAARQGKINEYGLAAINAYDRGDMEGAKKMLLATSAYITPGYTPEANIDPKTGSFIVASYDKEGNPHSGMALTRDNLVDFFTRNSGPEGAAAWSERDWTKKYQGAQLAAMLARDAETQKVNSWDHTLKLSAEDRAVELQGVQVAAERAQQRANESAARVAEATEGGAINAAQKANLVSAAESDQKLAAIARDKADKAVKRTLEMYSMSHRQLEENRKAAQSGTEAGPTEPALLLSESGDAGKGIPWDWTAKNYEVGSSGRIGHFGRAQFGLDRLDDAKRAGAMDPNMTPEQFASDTPKGREAQMNVEAWHWKDIEDFIYEQGLDKYIGSADADGNPITMNGMKFAAHIAGKTGMLNWIRAGKHAKDVYGNGPSQYMRLAVEGKTLQPGQTAPAQGVPTGVAGVDYDPLSGAPITPKGKAEEDYMVPHPYFMNEPDANGFQTPREGLMTLMTDLSMNLDANNPDTSEEDISHVLSKTFGPQGTKVTFHEDKDTGEIVIDDGLHQLKIDNSKEIVGQIYQFREDEKEVIEKMTPYGQRFPGTTETPTPTPLPEQSPTPGPAARPGAGIIGMPSVQPGFATQPSLAPAPGAPTAPTAPAIPEPGAAGAAARPDDTAVRTPQPQQAPATASVISRVPALAQAVQAYQRATASGNAQQAQMAAEALREVLMQLPPTERSQAAREVQALMGETGMPEFR